MSGSRGGGHGRWIALLIFCALTLLVPWRAAAQEQPLRIVVSGPHAAGVSGNAVGEADRRLETLLRQWIVNELQTHGFAVNGAAADADLRLDVFYLAGATRLTLVLSATEVESGGVVAGGSWTGTIDLALVNVVRQAADAMAGQIRAASAVSRQHPQPPLVLQQLRLRSADQGMAVYLSDELQLGIIEDGVLHAPFIPLQLGTQLQLRKQLDGYHSDSETITITAQYLDVELAALQPQIDWEFSLSWMPQRWAGAAVGLRRYLLPERFYAQGTTQLSTRYRFAAGSRASSVLDTRLSAGGYLVALRNGFHLGASSGAGVTLSLLGGEGTAYWFADPYLNVFSVSAKWQFARFAPFIQTDLVYYGEAGTGYLVRGTHEYVSAGVLLPWQP